MKRQPFKITLIYENHSGTPMTKGDVKTKVVDRVTAVASFSMLVLDSIEEIQFVPPYEVGDENDDFGETHWPIKGTELFSFNYKEAQQVCDILNRRAEEEWEQGGSDESKAKRVLY